MQDARQQTATVAALPAARVTAAPGALAAMAGQRALAREAAVLLALGGFALALRLPYYQVIPVFTDETEELYTALLVARGEVLPLTNATPIIGSLWNYIVAAAFLLSGYSLYAPRTVILAIGVLTVLATYPLGRAWGGRVGGLLAAALLTTAGGHIVVNSHVAWSNCASPLFTTLGAWTLYVAIRGGTLRPSTALLLAGLFWGLAFQTHPAVLALLPGAGLFLLWKGRPLFRTRWPYLAAGIFLLVNLNLLVFNLSTGFRSVTFGMTKAASYVNYEPLTPAVYVGRLGRLLFGLFQNLGGAVDLRDGDARFLLDIGLWPIALLALAGVAYQWRRGNPLPGLLLLSTALILPLFNGNFEPVLKGRYLMPLLPVLFAGVGAFGAAAIEHLRRTEDGRRATSARLGMAVLGLAAAFLILHPLPYLETYYRQVPEVGRTNARVFQTVDQIIGNRPSDEVVLIDAPLDDIALGPGAGRVSSAFRLALALEGVPYRRADLDNIAEHTDPANRCRDQLVILGSRRPIVNEEIVAKLDLRDLDRARARAHSQASRYGLYRLDRLPDAPGC